jgi:cytosine/adenosine deaminase-related metal-dependent hydrolase
MTIARRTLLRGLAASAALPGVVDAAAAQESTPRRARGKRRTLLKGGYVVTMDATLGELPIGDVLIEDGAIAQVAPSIKANDAEIVDARRKVVMPGLIDTHRHTWETLTRSWISEGDLAVYMKIITGTIGPHFRPEDVYIGNLLGAFGAMNGGITTMLDWSHIMNSPAHADAAVHGLADSGLRAVFAYGYSAIPGWDKAAGAEDAHAADVKRVQQKFFGGSNTLLTMAIASRSDAPGTIADIKLARSLGLRTTMHVTRAGFVTALNEAGMLGPDLTHVHTIGIEATDDEYRLIAQSGGTISSSSATEMMSGHGYPSAQRWLKFGLRPSFSVDNETRMPSDLFAQMRALVLSDHMLETERVRKEGGRPVLIPIRDVLSFATVEGARATGLDKVTGSLTPGKRADIAVIDLDDIALIPAMDPVATVVLRVHAGNVSWVFVDGVAVKRAGKLVGFDEKRVRRLVAASNTYLMGLMREAGLDIRRG